MAKKHSKSSGSETFIGVRVDSRKVERIDRLAQANDPKLSRSQILRLIIDRGIEGVEREKAEFAK